MTYTPKYLKKWQCPDSYYGATWPEWYVFLGQHRDSDSLTRSNFQVALEKLGGESETVRVVHEGHWAVGWIEWIGIHRVGRTGAARAPQCAAALATTIANEIEAACD